MRSRKKEKEILDELRLIRIALENLNENLISLVNIQMLKNSPNFGNVIYPWKPPYEITSSTNKRYNNEKD